MTEQATKPRFSNEKAIFGVHFNMGTFDGDELFVSPMLKNNQQPTKINFNKFGKVEPKTFNPNVKTDKESYFLLDQNGYTYHNQYPGVRKDVTEEEGNYRFHLGVEYPWYKKVFKDLPARLQYEYIELELFLNRVIRGLTALTIVVGNPIETQQRREAAAAKGKELSILYQRIVKEFKGTYPEYTIDTSTNEETQEAVVVIKLIDAD